MCDAKIFGQLRIIWLFDRAEILPRRLRDAMRIFKLGYELFWEKSNFVTNNNSEILWGSIKYYQVEVQDESIDRIT